MAAVLLRGDRSRAGVPVTAAIASDGGDELRHRPIALVDLLDRVLAKGVVVSGDLVIAIADVDLVRVSLRALISSVRAGTVGLPGLSEGGAS